MKIIEIKHAFLGLLLLATTMLCAQTLPVWEWRPTNIENGATDGMVITYSAGSLRLTTPPAAGYYQTIQVNGAGFTQRQVVDYINTSTISFAGTDNGGSGKTEVRATVIDASIALAKLAANAVDSTKIAQNSVSHRDIAQGGATSGQVLQWNGNMWLPTTPSGGGGGITTLNTLTAATQTFATGTTGSDFNISSATSTHTFNLPTASASNRGALSTTDWSIFNNKIGGSGTGSATDGYIPFFSGTKTIGNANTMYWNETNGALSIGTTSSSDAVRLRIIGGGTTLSTTKYTGTYTGTGTAIGTLVDYTFNPSGTHSGWFYATGNYMRINGSQIKGNLAGAYYVLDHAGTGAVALEVALKNEINSNNGGVITEQRVTENLAYNTNAVANTTVYGTYSSIQGNYTNAYGAYNTITTSGGFTPTNSYGTYIGVINGTNAWGVYSSTSASNYFNGSVGIGASTTVPAAKLHINSAAVVTTAIQRWENASVFFDQFGVTATPEGVITAPPGAIANGTLSGVGVTWIKETGSGNTGWKQSVTAGNVGSSAWALVGNTPTAGIHFLGSTNNVSLRFRTNNTQRMKVDSVGNVGIAQDVPVEKLDVVGKVKSDALVIRDWATTENTNIGEVHFKTGSGTESPVVTIGDGERAFGFTAKAIERQCIDYDVAWTTGRTKAFWTVPAKYNGWEIYKITLMVSTVGTGTNTVETEKGGTAIATTSITSPSHVIVVDTAISTGDIITWEVTAISGTPTRGLSIELELSHH